MKRCLLGLALIFGISLVIGCAKETPPPKPDKKKAPECKTCPDDAAKKDAVKKDAVKKDATPAPKKDATPPKKAEPAPKTAPKAPAKPAPKKKAGG